MQYYETYYYANIIGNLLADPFAYLRKLHEWHEDRQAELFTASFPRWSVLHSFSHFVISGLLDEHVNDVTADEIANKKSTELWVDAALRHHGFQIDGFRKHLETEGVALADLTEDHIADYHNELWIAGPLEDFLDALSEETLFVLFSNRSLLCNLHSYIAGLIQSLRPDEVEAEFSGRFAAEGRLKRKRIPAWAKNAVFFRDRGLCAHCAANLSGVLTAQTDDNFDHIVPLKQGGINDVTNLQLLCGKCNKGKGPRPASPSPKYEAWY